MSLTQEMVHHLLPPQHRKRLQLNQVKLQRIGAHGHLFYHSTLATRNDEPQALWQIHWHPVKAHCFNIVNLVNQDDDTFVWHKLVHILTKRQQLQAEFVILVRNWKEFGGVSRVHFNLVFRFF